MNDKKLCGVIPPVATPLNPDGSVDTVGLQRIVAYLLDGGVHGLFANGSMSGFPFLTDKEQIRGISTVVEAANGRVPVMGGLGEIGTARAIMRAREIAATGVTHLTVLAPLFYFTAQDQLIRYFSDIAAAVDLPIILYDNPVLTKNPIHPETVLEVRHRVPSIVGIKESNQDCINLQRLLSLTKDDESFSVLTGSEYLILVGLQMGVSGTVGGLHNLCPSAAVKLYNSFQAGDIAGADTYQNILIELSEIFTVGGSIWGSFQDAVRYLGLAERTAGEPYVSDVSPAQSDAVRAILSRHITPGFPSLPRFVN